MQMTDTVEILFLMALPYITELHRDYPEGALESRLIQKEIHLYVF